MVEDFTELQKNTDAYLNSLLEPQSFAFLHGLLEAIDNRLAHFEVSFKTYMDSFPSVKHDYGPDLIAAIETRAGHQIPTICIRRARANIHGPILNTLSEQLHKFRRELAKRIEWCRAANDCLSDASERFKEKRPALSLSSTTSFVWTQDAIEELISKGKARFKRKFIDLLEQRDARGSDLNPKICFLPNLNQSLSSRKATETAALEAAEKALREEITANAELKREEGMQSMHQLLENASPPWQIERLGEDLATVSMTTCSPDSESGQIIARSGKNVSFSRNGNSQ